jgi:hypothetical protein
VLGVRLSGQTCDHDHTSPLQIAHEAFLAKHPVIIVRASRGAGKTYMAAALGIISAAALGADVTILGGSAEQSERVHEHMRAMWERSEILRRVIVGEPTRRKTVLANGATIRALAASSRSVRGPHPQRLILDEVDEIERELIDAALGQPMDRGRVRSGVLAVSTMQYAEGGMRYMLDRAREQRWRVYEYCWREVVAPHGWLDRAALDRMRATVPEHVWRIEYELGEIVPENAAIDPGVWERVLLPGREIDDRGRLVVCEEYDERGHYVVGVDWARSEHATVMVVLRCDRKPYRVVAYHRMRRIAWLEQVQRAEELSRRYRAHVYHDRTGIGDVVHGALGVPSTGVVFSEKTRTRLISDYIRGLERGDVVMPRIASLVGEHRGARWDDLFGRGHLPDSVSAMMLAYYGARRGEDCGITI